MRQIKSIYLCFMFVPILIFAISSVVYADLPFPTEAEETADLEDECEENKNENQPNVQNVYG